MIEAISDWVVGYAACRGLQRPVPVPNGVWLEIGNPDERGRIVLATSEMSVVADLVGRIERPGLCIEVPTAVDPTTIFDESRWSIRETAFVMVANLTAAPVADCDFAWEVDLHVEPAVIRIAARVNGEQEVAASGTCAIVGSACVFDRIITREEHRRKGLATLVMARLTSAAIAQGAQRGILIATPSGRALYTRLGWADVTPIVSALRI